MSKKSSTFQIVLLCAFGALGVAGILIFALATAGGSNNGLAPVTIWGTLDATTMKNALRAASESDSRYLDITYVQKDPATYESSLANALASGTGPDLFLLTDNEALYDGQKVYPIPYSELSQAQFQNTFVGASEPFLASSGVLAIPLLVDPLVMYWNHNMLASAGIAQPPQYWDQLPTMTTALTQKDASGNLAKEAIALGTYSNIDEAQYILSMLIEQAGGQITAQQSGQLVAALSQSGSASGPALQAIEYYTEFANPSQSEYSWNDAQPDARQSFAAGNLAMYIGLASEEPAIIQTNPNLDFSAAPVPQVRNSQTSVDEGTVYGLAIPRNDPNISSALTIAFLMASESFDNLLASSYGLAPARLDAIAAGPQTATSTIAYSQPADFPLFFKQALIIHTWADPNPSQSGPIFQSMIEDTESGAAQASGAIGTADSQLQQLISQMQSQ